MQNTGWCTQAQLCTPTRFLHYLVWTQTLVHTHWSLYGHFTLVWTFPFPSFTPCVWPHPRLFMYGHPPSLTLMSYYPIVYGHIIGFSHMDTPQGFPHMDTHLGFPCMDTPQGFSCMDTIQTFHVWTHYKVFHVWTHPKVFHVWTHFNVFHTHTRFCMYGHTPRFFMYGHTPRFSTYGHNMYSMY